MLRALTLAAAACTAGCITTTTFVRHQEVTWPYLAGAVAADVVVVSAIASQAEDFTLGATLATTAAVTAADLAVGCMFGACAPLKP